MAGAVGIPALTLDDTRVLCLHTSHAGFFRLLFLDCLGFTECVNSARSY